MCGPATPPAPSYLDLEEAVTDLRAQLAAANEARERAEQVHSGCDAQVRALVTKALAAIRAQEAAESRAAAAERERDEWRANAILHGGNFEREALAHNTTRSSLSRAVEALREIDQRTGHFGEAPPPPEWMPMLSLIAWVGRTARAAIARPGAGKEGERG